MKTLGHYRASLRDEDREETACSLPSVAGPMEGRPVLFSSEPDWPLEGEGVFGLLRFSCLCPANFFQIALCHRRRRS